MVVDVQTAGSTWTRDSMLLSVDCCCSCWVPLLLLFLSKQLLLQVMVLMSLLAIMVLVIVVVLRMRRGFFFSFFNIPACEYVKSLASLSYPSSPILLHLLQDDGAFEVYSGNDRGERCYEFPCPGGQCC